MPIKYSDYRHNVVVAVVVVVDAEIEREGTILLYVASILAQQAAELFAYDKLKTISKGIMCTNVLHVGAVL